MLALGLVTGCSRPGSLEFESQPPQAGIWVDDELHGKTPLELSPPAPEQTVHIRAALSGYVDWEASYDSTTWPDEPVQIVLQKRLALSLSITSQPTGATVFLNREQRGRTPLTFDRLESGSYQLMLQLPGRESVKRDIDLQASENVHVKLPNPAITMFRQRIAENPKHLHNHVDLVHELMLDGETIAAMEALATGMPVAITNTPDNAKRFWDEINKIANEQYEYGSDKDVSRARAGLKAVFFNYKGVDPNASALFYAQFARTLSLSKEKVLAKEICLEGLQIHGKHKALAEIAEEIGVKFNHD
jgi:hypothetical protein